jgi:hypothetical protein
VKKLALVLLPVVTLITAGCLGSSSANPPGSSGSSKQPSTVVISSGVHMPAPLSIPAGQGGLEVRLRFASGAAGGNGGTRPLQNQGVVLVNAHTAKTLRLRTNRYGGFRIAVPPGLYVVKLAWAYPHGPRWGVTVTTGHTTAKTLTEFSG